MDFKKEFGLETFTHDGISKMFDGLKQDDELMKSFFARKICLLYTSDAADE